MSREKKKKPTAIQKRANKHSHYVAVVVLFALFVGVVEVGCRRTPARSRGLLEARERSPKGPE